MTKSRAQEFDVAIPLQGLNASGGVRMVLHVANALAARGVSVAVSVPAHAATPPIPLHRGVTLLERNAGAGSSDRLAFVTEMPRARVVLATGFQTPLFIRLGNRSGARMVYLIQGDEIASHIDWGSQPAAIKPFLRAWARLGYRVPATRIAVSRYVAERVGASRIQRVIAPGIEPEFIDRAERTLRSRSDDRVVVGTFAHPAKSKGTRVAFDAFAKVDHPSRVRFVAFDGETPAPVPASVEPFSHIARTEGIPHDVVSFMAYLDVFVFPSFVEGFGLPPLEAMACGAAVVTADAGGVREYTRDGENCLVVAPGDVDATAHAIQRVSTEPGAAHLRARLVAAGRATALAYTVERFANACADEIERLLSGGNRS